jgi:hypothetical protein
MSSPEASRKLELLVLMPDDSIDPVIARLAQTHRSRDEAHPRTVNRIHPSTLVWREVETPACTGGVLGLTKTLGSGAYEAQRDAVMRSAQLHLL